MRRLDIINSKLGRVYYDVPYASIIQDAVRMSVLEEWLSRDIFGQRRARPLNSIAIADASQAAARMHSAVQALLKTRAPGRTIS